ncbi:hypothetical protein [Phormidium sp. CCY1219]|nr:hypothetical protein [Phormidium sp. CCY1219]MEB3831075.1 hypothetical protein [Phormidium sp. CCY1219]
MRSSRLSILPKFGFARSPFMDARENFPPKYPVTTAIASQNNPTPLRGYK